MGISYICRPFRSHAGYTLATIVALGISIGACLAITAVFQACFLSSSHYSEPDELFWLRSSKRSKKINPDLTRSLFEDGSIFDAFAAYSEIFTLKLERPNGGYINANASLVMGNPFQVLGIFPGQGRFFNEEETREGFETTGIISHKYWREQLGGETSAVGRVYNLEGHPVRIIGVLPENFTGLSSIESYDIYIPAAHYKPLVIPDFESNINWHSMTAIGRKGNGNKQLIVDQLGAFFSSYLQSHPAKDFIEPRLYRLREDTFHQRQDLFRLYSLFGGVILALFLIALCNALTFVALRASWQSSELLIRLALGATSRRMLMHFAVEAVTYVATSSVLSLVCAWAMLRALQHNLPELAPTDQIPVFTLGVLFVSVCLAVMLTILFAVIPLLWIRRLDLGSLASGERGASRRIRSLPFLAAIQMAATTLLVIFSLLFIRSSFQAVHVDTGYAVEPIAAFDYDLAHLNMDEADYGAVHDEILAAVNALPEVEVAARGSINFLQEIGTLPVLFESESASEVRGNEKLTRLYFGDEHFLELLGIPILQGRSFQLNDRYNTDRAVIVNEAFLDEYFSNQNPLGIRFRLINEEKPLLHVVGIIPNFRITRGEKEYPVVVLNDAQFGFEGSGILVRGRTDGDSAKLAVEMLLNQQFSKLGVQRVSTGHDLFHESIAELKTGTAVISVAGAQAVGLSLVGLFIVFSFSAVLRKRDFAIRMALGASPRQIVKLAFFQFGMICFSGLLAGVVLAVLIAPFAEKALLDVSPTDPLVYAFAIALVAGTGAFVAFLVSLRTLRVQPSRELM